MALEVLSAGAIPDIKILRPARFGDARGFLSEVYSRRALADAGLALDFVQENHSYSARAGTVRGLHFQLPPHAQAKLVRVCRGAIYDVALDLRRGSATFGAHVGVVVSAEAWNQVLVPVGFAHGFCTLEPDTHVVYLLTDHYSPERERGVRWDDPALGIDWPVAAGDAIVSERDQRLPPLSELTEVFG